ncbi:glycosyltransferase family 4 protein [Paenibacillus filicis]|uniref:Glycosyltransferase family 4 protein n=1 Tax=Paenibacillus gyeongsangnamensis TaxID=3388067 RepID=A0ABT4Q9X9_9BACL|nr:glycosyltransferase family 4 protein [Paenibacillus filicis]MCZ8513591.1 glycosyltransferase family 4 protein [Paenibacillus filicis]
MRVVIPVGALHLGGGCKNLADVANALHTRGHDTEVLVPEGMPVVYDVHCKLTRIPSLDPSYIPYGDIVLANFYTTFKACYEAWPRHCVRFSQAYEPHWVPDKEFALWTYAHGVPIVSLSHWLDDQIFNDVGQRTFVLNPGIDPQIFYPSPVRKRLDKDKRKIILYLARDPDSGYELKGFHDFVKCMELFKEAYRGKFIVYMVCPEKILSLPSGIPYRTFGAVSDKEFAELYRTADVFVSSSWIEAYGFPPLEAMACGTPVVTTNSGGILDFSEHLKSAFITPPRDPRSLALALQAVLTDEDLYQTLIRGGLESASRFTQYNFEQRFVNVMEQIVRERSWQRK